IVPALVLRSAGDAAKRSSDMVRHTLEVDAQAQSLALHVRDTEAAALSLAAGVDTPRLRQRLANSRQQIGVAMAALQRLTEDNPEQQRRLGELQNQVGLRLGNMDAVAQAGRAATHAQVDAAVRQYPVGDLIAKVIAEERGLL
ncbi:CHASE3 domain-containing protein, partial [Staphylococcus pseudintermedius]